MASHKWTLVCTRAVVDQGTNLMSLFDLVEQMNGPRPAAAPDKKTKTLMPVRWQIVTFWSRSKPDVPERFRSVCVIRGPDGSKLYEGRQDLALTQHQNVRGIFSIAALPFKGDGPYRISVFFENGSRRRKVHETVIPLVYVDSPPNGVSSTGRGKPRNRSAALN